jgi:hypothetical protein
MSSLESIVEGKMTKSAVEIVLARYDENVAWSDCIPISELFTARATSRKPSDLQTAFSCPMWEEKVTLTCTTL